MAHTHSGICKERSSCMRRKHSHCYGGLAQLSAGIALAQAEERVQDSQHPATIVPEVSLSDSLEDRVQAGGSTLPQTSTSQAAEALLKAELPSETKPDRPLAEAASKPVQQAEEEEERRKVRRRKKSRIRELEDIRAELATRELALLERERDLLDKDQNISVLKEELDVERKIRGLLTKEKEKAEEEAALAMGLCTGGSMLP